MSARELTDAEIRTRLAECGYAAGPVTKTTRRPLLVKLERLEIAKGALAGTCRLSAAESEREETGNAASGDLRIVFFDLETSGLEDDCDILQIALCSGESTFHSYVKPTKEISPAASAVNNLYNRNGELYLAERRLDTRAMELVLDDLLLYLSSFAKKCLLVAHNCSFDSRRLVRHMEKLDKAPAFARLLGGFADTLALFATKFPERRGKKGRLTLKTLAKELVGAPTDCAHDAVWDAAVLQRLTRQHFTVREILAARTSYELLRSAGYRRYGIRNA